MKGFWRHPANGATSMPARCARQRPPAIADFFAQRLPPSLPVPYQATWARRSESRAVPPGWDRGVLGASGRASIVPLGLPERRKQNLGTIKDTTPPHVSKHFQLGSI